MKQAFCYYLLLVLVIAACGENQSDEDPRPLAIGKELPVASQIAGSDLANAKSFCQALEYKRVNVFNNFPKGEFNFRLQGSDCDAQIFDNTEVVKIEKSRGSMYFVAETKFPTSIEAIPSTKDGIFNDACRQLDTPGDEASNTITVSEYERIQIYMDNPDEVNNEKVVKATIGRGTRSDTTKEFIVSEIQTFWVYTVDNRRRNQNRRGMAAGIRLESACPANSANKINVFTANNQF